MIRCPGSANTPATHRFVVTAGCAMSLILMLLPGWVLAADAPVHHDPIAPVILGVTGILFFAIVGRFGARHFNQPSVLGELLMGVLLGNVGYYFGVELIVMLREVPAVFEMVDLVLHGQPLADAADAVLGQPAGQEIVAIVRGPNGGALMQIAHAVDIFSRYGVIFMLFLVGLETDLEEMKTVGADSARVAIIGVVLPFLLGFAATRVLIPNGSLNTSMFVAATLGATSVGITARVLQEINMQGSRAGHIILGAAVLDDILGLMILAVVSGIIVSGGVQVSVVVNIVALALLFLVGSIYLAPYLLRPAIQVLSRLDLVEAKMFASFIFVMILAWMANVVGLATIIGAFTAGVILHEGFFKELHTEARVVTVKDLIMPLEVILVPIFFVLMGLQVKLNTFLDLNVVLLALALLFAAMLGKILSGWGAWRSRERLLIGLGMMPRGEVGLIFAAIGKSLGVITDALFSAVVLMVVVTTMAAPPLIKLAAARLPKGSELAQG